MDLAAEDAEMGAATWGRFATAVAGFWAWAGGSVARTGVGVLGAAAVARVLMDGSFLVTAGGAWADALEATGIAALAFVKGLAGLAVVVFHAFRPAGDVAPAVRLGAGALAAGATGRLATTALTTVLAPRAGVVLLAALFARLVSGFAALTTVPPGI
ncbi:membrane hypothetical protein [Thiomonas sp. X19]|nr:membrane hypothetical protein [Thiomonas sp. X19]